MIGPSHPARDDVLVALSLVEGTIASPGIEGADCVALCAAASALRKANDKLRPGTPGTAVAPLVTVDSPVVPIHRAIGMASVKCW